MKNRETILRSELLACLGIKRSALSRKISRGWASQQDNPAYNGKNDRYLIPIDSIQDAKVRNRIRQKLKEAGEAQELSLEEAREAGGDALERTMLAGTVKHLATNANYLYTHFSEEIERSYPSHTGYYLKYKLTPVRLQMYARTASFIICTRRMYQMIVDELDHKDLALYETALIANLYTLITFHKEDLQLICPVSFHRFQKWLEEKVTADFEVIDELLPVKNAHNRARTKLLKVQTEIIRQWYGEGLTGTQIFEKMKVVARKQKWPELSQGTIYRCIQATANDVSLERHGKMEFINNVVPTISRSLPACKNELWGVDTTAHDELVHWNGKTQKQLWVCRVYDYATMRMLGSSTSYKMEDGNLITEALATAVRQTGHAPKFINMDHGPGYHFTADWCEKRGIHVMASGVGKARAKLIEQLLGQLRYYNMTLPGYIGQNRTSKSLDSKVAGKRYDRARRSAPGYAEAIRHAVTEAQEAWNNHIIKTLDKTPNELWSEKASKTEVLPAVLLAGYYGHQHAIKPGIGGLTVQKDREKVTFFPSIENEEARRTAVYFFKKHFKRERGRTKLTVACVDDYKVAYVFNKPLAEGGVHLITMGRKPLVPMVAKTPGEHVILNQFLALQKEFTSTAVAVIDQAKEAYTSHDDFDFLEKVKNEKYTGQTRHLPPAGKEFLRLEEGGFVDRDGVLHEESDLYVYEEKRDPDTGEIITLRIKRDE